MNLTAVTKEISENWNRLSAEEQEAITAEPMQQLEELRESRKLAAHSVPLNSFHDMKSTIKSIETQVSLVIHLDSHICCNMLYVRAILPYCSQRDSASYLARLVPLVTSGRLILDC